MANKKIRKIGCILLAGVTLATAVPTISLMATDTTSQTQETDTQEPTETEMVGEGVIDQSEWITIADYEVIAESDTYRLYYYEPRLSVILENKQTGALLESTLSDEKDDGLSNAGWLGRMKSGILINAIIGTNNTHQVDLLNNAHTIETKPIENGVSATIFYTDFQFGVTVNITLEDDELVVNIPNDSIVEKKDGTYISTISLFPMMGYSYLDDKSGYMLIPDGNGALIYLDDKEGRFQAGYSQMIYGTDDGFEASDNRIKLWDKYEAVVEANRVVAPVYGMAHTDDQIGYLAVVEDGDKRATIEAMPNGVMVNYNRIYSKFLLRDVYVQPLNQSNSGTVKTTETNRTQMDMTVRFLLLSGEEADYAGMANAYRDYLLNQKLVNQKDCSYNSRVDFLGTDREEFLLSTTAVTMTTTKQIEQMYKELQDAGLDSLLTVYKGWQKGGIYNIPISSYKADSNIGGTSKLTDLITDSAASGYHIYLYNDALRINATTNSTTFNAVKMVNKRTLKDEVNAQVYDMFYYSLPNKTQTTLSKFLDSYTKKDVNTLAVAGISNHLFSYCQQGTYYNRVDTAETYQSLFAQIDDSADLILEQPFAYLWQYTDAFLDMPLSSSEYMYVDEDVPFLALVLKGIVPMYSEYVNFEANKTEFFLQMVESGVYPSFYITYENSSKLIYTNSSDLYSTQYDTYKDSIIEYDEALRAVADKVQNANIINHERLDNGVTRVTYSNGVVIYVNYSKKDVAVDDIVVKALSYEVGEADE